MDPKETTKQMIVDLSPDEIADLAMRLSDKRIEWEKTKAEKEEVLSELNAKLKTLDAEISTLAKETHEHKAEREVPVREIFDEERKMVEVRRLSDNSLVETRDMTMQEKGDSFHRAQPGLFDGTDPDAPGKLEDDDDDVSEDDGNDEPAEPQAEAADGAPKNSKRRVPRDLPPEEDAAS